MDDRHTIRTTVSAAIVVISISSRDSRTNDSVFFFSFVRGSQRINITKNILAASLSFIVFMFDCRLRHCGGIFHW